MNVFLATSRTRVLRPLALAAVVAVLLGSGQAAAAPTLSPAETPAFAEAVVRSVRSYWGPQLAEAGHPGWGFRYWISGGAESVASPCGVMGDPRARPGAEPASYCRTNNAVYLSSSFLFDYTSNHGTAPYGIAVVIAHEAGHAVQAELRLGQVELQADCFAGAWVGRHVRNGQATTKDAYDAQRVTATGGNYEGSSHGTPEQRVSAWRAGFNGGPSSCGG